MLSPEVGVGEGGLIGSHSVDEFQSSVGAAAIKAVATLSLFSVSQRAFRPFGNARRRQAAEHLQQPRLRRCDPRIVVNSRMD